jgi:hypothetical protein
MIPSQSSHLLPSSPDFPPLSAFSFLSGLCSGGSSDPCLSPTPLPSTSSLSRSPMAVRHHLSIEDPDPVGTVSRFTPSTNVDAVDAASSISPLFATLTENTGGWGTTFQSRSPHCHPRRVSLPRYFITSLPCFATPIPPVAYSQLSSYPGGTPSSRESSGGQRRPSNPSSPHCSLSTIHYSPPIQKQAPSPAVIHPSGHVCPGGA